MFNVQQCDLSFLRTDIKKDYVMKIMDDISYQLGRTQFEDDTSTVQDIPESFEENDYEFIYKFISIPEPLKEVLKGMLQFNPYFRFSAQESLQKPAFNRFYELQLPYMGKKKVSLMVDQEGMFDYEKNFSKVGIDNLKLQLMETADSIRERRLILLQTILQNHGII